MEEKVIIKGEFSTNKAIMCFPLGVIVTVFGFLISSIETKSYYSPFTYKPYETFGAVIGCIGLCLIAICVISLIIYGFANYEMIVTDKRVYGKIKFGKRVDLPLDSITAIGLSVFKSIAITTPSGAIKFVFMKNRDVVYNEISKLIRERQETKNTTVITQDSNNADELKKYKDLLDSGVITQEEFEAKKKQILGL